MNDINAVNLLFQMRAMTEKSKMHSMEGASASSEAFGSILQQTLNQVDQLTQGADALKTQYEMGDSSVSLGEVMIASQKASLGFEATVRVRNKLVQAYQDVMNMPV